MREIKFRVWDGINKVIKNDLAAIDFEKKTIYFINKENSITSDEHREFWYEPFTLMQYTGLKDKNGREIYEGDVIRFTNGIDEVYEEVGAVVFDLEECGYKAQYIDDGVKRCIYLINPKVFADKYTEITYEIIGNIYENPELLEVAK